MYSALVELLEIIKKRAERAIAEKVFPGCVIGIVRADGTRTVMPFGNLTYEADSPKVRENTIYDLASITKSIPVASLALVFAAEGRLSLTDAVKKYVPELRNDHGATIQDLLMYRVAGTRFSTLKDRTPAEIFEHVFKTGFNGPPAERRYTNLPAFLLGLVIERVTRRTIDDLAQDVFFKPLHMNNTTYFPDVGSYDLPTSMAPTEVVDGHEVRGIVHDESARVFARAQKAVGHAGLFSTAPDMLNFLEALLKNDEFTKSIIAGAQKGLGWHVGQPWFMGTRCAPTTFGKTGFTGTSLLCDSERGVGLVILSNRTYPKRPADAASIHSTINAFRVDIANALYK